MEIFLTSELHESWMIRARMYSEFNHWISLYQRWQQSLISTYSYITVVGLVSLYDIVLTVRYAVSLKQLEENPIGRWLMQLDKVKNDCMPDLTWFLTAKCLGTLLVLGILYALVQRSARIGHPIAIGVSTFQIVLAMYLTFGTLDAP